MTPFFDEKINGNVSEENKNPEMSVQKRPLHASNTRPKWVRRSSELIAAAFILTFTVPWRPASEAPIGAFDFSWMLLLHDAVATGRQFGTQIILPQGPLGFIGTSVYDPRTYAVLIAARILIGLGRFSRCARRPENLCKTRLPAGGWMVVIIALIGATPDHTFPDANASPDHFYPACAVLLLVNYFWVHGRKLARHQLA